MKALLTFLGSAVFAAAFAAGFIGVQTAGATTTYTIEIMGGGYPYMTCGWHEDCEALTAGVALDWQAYSSNHAFYFRSFAYKSSGGPSTIAQGTVAVPSGQACKTVYVDLSSGGGYRGTEIYLHVTAGDPGETIYIVGSTTGYWTQSQIGSTVSPDNENCPWEEEHLHQRGYWENVSGSSRNTSYFPGYVNAQAKDIDVQGHHQDAAYWAY